MAKGQRQLGNQGEQLAAQYLEKQAYRIITTNWHCAQGEIDIVAQQGATWVFVEVKTRRAVTTETAFASITPQKREKLIAAVYAYLSDEAQDDEAIWRIDAIAVALRRNQPPVIDHVEDALGW